jgi:hypothetical protein
MADGKTERAQRHDRPEVAEDIVFQERTWAVQRMGWWAMALLIAAALAGLFATGPLSSAETRDGTGALTVGYDRFQRHATPSSLRLHLGRELTAADAVAVHINSALADAVEVERMVPRPQHAKLTASGVEYTFAVAEPGRPASIRFILAPSAVGLLRAEIGLTGREPARFTVFVYP